MSAVVFTVLLSSIPLLAVTAVTWRLVWPRWKLLAKLVLHPFIYGLLAVYIGYWTVLLASLHQGLLDLGGHIWFSRKHGFTWYAIEDPERYIRLSKAMVGAFGKSPKDFGDG